MGEEWARERVAGLPKARDGKPIAFHALRRDQFPFTVQIRDEATGEELWAETVEGPGALKIPGKKDGQRILTIVTFPGEDPHVIDSDGRTYP